MNLYKNCVGAVLLLAFFASVCSASDDGFLNVTCDQASDCYILPSKGLELYCSYNVHKCKCSMLTYIRSKVNLKWKDGQCLMSKYGPCGARGDVAVGCQDNFICIDNQCRDPTNTGLVKVVPFVFEEAPCSLSFCSFGDMRLKCNYESNQCECAESVPADAPSSYWDTRNYDGNKNCSVGKFGPCGTRNGITIDCHGDGITCVNGTCLDANHIISDVGEDCAFQSNCKEGLLCSANNVCIEPFSVGENKICHSKNECRKELQCRRYPGAGPWSYPFCRMITTEEPTDY